MTRSRGPRALRIVLRCYPRSFRERFGHEMTQLFLDQRRDGAGSVRLVLREAIDCLRTAPRLHLEGSMTSRVVLIVLAIATIAGFVLGGPIGLLPAVALAVALVALRGERPIGALTGTHWWSWFAGAVAAFVVMFTVLAIDGDELTSGGWVVAFLSFNVAVGLAVIGVATGAVRLLHHARPPRG